MTLQRLLTILCALLLPLGTAQAAPDWTRTVTPTPEGGFRMGNPQAKVKLIGYSSLTCPHCRRFDRDGKAALAAYVRKGEVSYEFRNFVLNGVDVSATLAARCGGASKFFPVVTTLYATQPRWMGRLTGLSQEGKDKLNAVRNGERMIMIAEVSGVAEVARRNGVNGAELKTCLGDEAAVRRLALMSKDARSLGVQGTPTFFINGNRLGVNDWAGVEAEIKRAGG